MEISRLGETSFKIKGKKGIILVDPAPELKDLTAHVVFFSSETIRDRIRPEFGSEIKIRGEQVIIFGPGEYEIREMRIFGLKEKEKNFYRLEVDDLSLVYLGFLKEKIADEKLELLNQVDILFLSVVKAKLAVSLMAQLGPAVVIPIEDKGIEEFLKEEGIQEVEQVRKFVVSKGELPEERKVVILK